MRRSVLVVAVLSLLVAFVPGLVPAHAGDAVGSFEIEGNKRDDTPGVEPIDWGTPPPNLTNFTDGTGSSDNGFTGGSKELEPGGWTCGNASSPQKDDILSGQIAFRIFGGKQFIYTNYIRKAANGDAHIDYEFNQSPTPVKPGCPAVRTNGDIVITFDTENGGATILVRAFRWTFTGAGVGTFTQLPTGNKGTTFDGAVNIPANNDPALAGVPAGGFGEAALNLSDTIGSIACGRFASTYMKSRSSTSITSALQDFTNAQPANVGECPNSTLAKAVRNYPNGTFGTTATAKPGDTLEYRLTYDNAGNVPATGVVVTDTIQAKQTFVAGSCTPACTVNGNQLTWNLGTVQPSDAPITMTFRVTLDASFPLGDTHVKNVGVVRSDTEQPENSNETDTTVNASVNITSVKTVNPQTANEGDTVTYTIKLSNSGNQAGTTTITDNYDEAHLTVSNISPPGQDSVPPGTITWANISVPVGTDTVTLTYSALVKPGSFTGTPGGAPCTSTQFKVHNDVTLSNGGGSSADLCVHGQAAITSVKSVNPQTANEGDTVTYTIKLSNSGNIPGTTTITDNYDEAHLTVSNISPPGQDSNPPGTITWANVSVPVGTDTVTLTYSALVKSGSFTGTPGGAPCTSTQFKVHNDVTLSTGGGSFADLCVNGFSQITSSKSASPNPANGGQVVTYTIQLSNSGNITGTTNVTDDYDEAHIQVDPASISDGGTIVNGTIVWSNITVPPGTNTQTLTYSGTVFGTFSGPPGPDCQPGQFPVENDVTLSNGGGTNETLCVNAAPVLGLVKDTPTISVVNGETITYTLTYSNTGNAEATNVVITDTLPAGTTFNSCSDNCTHNGTVTWTIPSIPAGGGGFVTLTVNVVSAGGCQVCNQATIKIGANGTPTSSNNKCVALTPSANAAGANASGNATGANVFSSLLGLDLTLPTGNDPAPDHTSVDSTQSGIGSNDEANQVLAVDIPPPAPGSVLHANVLRAVTVSTVTALPSQARGTSVGSAANVNILNGTVTATVVRGAASATATGTSAAVSSIGSAIEGLQVLGVPQAVFPGAKINLPAAVFGAGSYVAIYEEIKSVTTPAPGQLSGGTYAGDITVNMIRVHVTNMLLVGQVEVIVGHATAHADFPQTTLCGPQARQAVSGSAFMARALTDPEILPVIVGAVEIPTSGGLATNSVNQIFVDPLVTSKAATSFTSGGFTSLVSTASSHAEAKFVCVLDTPTGCTISARLVRAQANSDADALNRTSNANGTDFVGLKIGGTTVSLPIPPNTVIALPGIGFVVLNEQFCDNGGTLATNCANGTVPGHTGLTVRAIHVVLLDPAAGGSPGVEVIVAEAHSDASFVAP